MMNRMNDGLPESGNHDLLRASTSDGFHRRGNSWYVSSDIPSDLLVKINDAIFHLHKYPLLSRTGRMNRLIYDSPRITSAAAADPTVVDLDDIPGGPDSFELAAKFCYGVAVDLNSGNISGLRCAAEYLEMTEDLEEGNLIFKTEAFLSYVVLSSWRDSIGVLKACEGLSPWAENLQIVRRCSESIAWKACANPRGIRWNYTGRPARSTGSPKWNSAGSNSKDSSPSRGQSPPPPDWWFEDVSLLRIDHFVRVITAIKVKGMHADLLGAAITHYASKWLPKETPAAVGVVEQAPWTQSAGLHLMVSSSSSKNEMSSAQIRDQTMIVESLISILPQQKDCISCAFLLRLLRMATMLRVASALVTELEKRVGMQLDQTVVQDLLIPCYTGGGSGDQTQYDVDLVQRLLEHFMLQEQTEEAGSGSAKVVRVARLVDSYLTEVARDRNLSMTKFQVLAEALPGSARACDDGLYRAVDSYLKAHPSLSEHERKRLCRVMDCQKLSIDACMHAAQNERLPLRVVVQVLFSEQVKISNAIAKSDAGGDHFHAPVISARRQLLEGTPQSFQDGWAAAKKDINTLKFELEGMKVKYLELQNDMDALQRQFEKMTPVAAAAAKGAKQGVPSSSSAWSSGWKKLSKLTKMTGAEGNAGGTGALAAVKGPRRWRNSIS